MSPLNNKNTPTPPQMTGLGRSDYRKNTDYDSFLADYDSFLADYDSFLADYNSFAALRSMSNPRCPEGPGAGPRANKLH